MNKRVHSGLRTVFWVHLVVGLVFGLAFFLLPTQSMQLYNWPQTSVFFPRLVGAAILGFTVSSWLALQANEWGSIRIIVQTEIAWTALASLGMIWGIFTEPVPALVWLNVVIMAGFALAFGYYYRLQEQAAPTKRPRRTAG